MTEHKSVVEAQLAVMGNVPYLQKRASADLPYTFAGEADLIRAVRDSMIAHGLTITPVGVEVIHQGEQLTKAGRPMPHIRLLLTYRLSHTSGTGIDIRVVGEALDLSDKAANKAMTIGLKYAIRQTFLIETGDDPDLVAHHRDADHVTWLSEGLKRIEKCGDSAALDSLMERFRGTDESGEPIFTAEQLAELTMYVERRRKKMK